MTLLKHALVAALDVATGQVAADCQPVRDGTRFLAFLGPGQRACAVATTLTGFHLSGVPRSPGPYGPVPRRPSTRGAPNSSA